MGPEDRPIAAPISDPRMIITTTAAPVDACQGMEPRIQTPTGNITAAATQARMAAKTTFSTATAGGQRGQQTVLDLVAVGELDDQREGGALEAGEDRGQRHQARKEDLLVPGPGVAELGQHLSEDEQQEQRLEDDLARKRGTRGR